MGHLSTGLNSLRIRQIIVGLAAVLALTAIIQFFPIRQEDLAHDGRSLELLDRSGQRLGTLFSRDERHGMNVPLAAISPQFVAAVLSAEDHRFFQHGAIDEVSLVRVAFDTLVHHRPFAGASTISMQLARIIDPVPPTFWGKLQEAIVAGRLESGLSKREILEAYCNGVPMGSNFSGVEAASRGYFGIESADLDLAQASLLAALPNNPVRLDPYRHWDALKARQRYVLERMRADGRINSEDAARAFSERIALQPQSEGIIAAPHFLFWLAPQISPERTRVTTTIDLPLQRFLQAQTRAVVESLASHKVFDASAIVIDNRTGQILAYVGSPDYFSDDILGRNDGVQALRQPGSALKPFLYELALERRIIRPATILQDVPTAYALPGAGIYRPHDYSNTYQGDVRVRSALANSLNIPAVRVLSLVGVGSFLDRLHTLGFSHLRKSADYYGLGLTLGGGEVSLYELTRAYVSAAHGGKAVRLVATLDTPPASTSSSLSEIPTKVRDETISPSDQATWALVTDMLADAHARAAAFGVDSVLTLPFAAAVKTGTSSDYRDTWTVGFTRDYTVGVWVGNFNGTPMRRISGVSGAGPLWNRIMLHLYERSEPTPFDPPNGYIHQPICAQTGTIPNKTCRSIVTEYLDAQDLRAYRRALMSKSSTVSPEANALRILFPHEGDRFVSYPGRDTRQLLQFNVTGEQRDLQLFLNGRLLAPNGGVYLWRPSPGIYTLRASSTSGEAVTHFNVIPPPFHRIGFSRI